MIRTPVEERRKQLVAAALRVVAAKGLAAASTRAIVAEADMALASFHYAFDSRDQLLARLVTEVLESEEKAVLPRHEQGRSLTELVRDSLRGYLAHLQADPTHEQAMLELTQYAIRSGQPLAKRQYEHYTRIALTSLEVAAENTGHTWSVPLPTVAALLVSLTDGLTLTWLVSRDDEAAEALIDAAATAVAGLAEAGVEGAPRAGAPR